MNLYMGFPLVKTPTKVRTKNYAYHSVEGEATLFTAQASDRPMRRPATNLCTNVPCRFHPEEFKHLVKDIAVIKDNKVFSLPIEVRLDSDQSHHKPV